MDTKVVLVVGGSRGLGRAVATRCAASGYKVYVLSRSRPTDLAGITYIPDDFTRKGTAQKYLLEIRPSMLIISAAAGLHKRIRETREDEIDFVVANTFAGSIHWIGESVTNLSTGSRVGWIASLTALIPDPNWSIYAACKAGVMQFIESARKEATQRGIGITVCFPGCLKTGFHVDCNTTTPQSAVEPDLVAQSMLSAIEDGDDFWAAPMDSEVVDEYFRLRQQFLIRFSGALE